MNGEPKLTINDEHFKLEIIEFDELTNQWLAMWYQKKAKMKTQADAAPKEKPSPDKIKEDLKQIHLERAGLTGQKKRGKKRMVVIHGEIIARHKGVAIHRKPLDDLLALGAEINNSKSVEQVLMKHFAVKPLSMKQYVYKYKEWIGQHPEEMRKMKEGTP